MNQAVWSTYVNSSNPLKYSVSCPHFRDNKAEGQTAEELVQGNLNGSSRVQTQTDSRTQYLNLCVKIP